MLKAPTIQRLRNMSFVYFSFHIGYDEIVEILIQNGADVNTTETDHETSLTLAAEEGSQF